MSIATAIQNAQQKVADAYTAISNKGGTLPATQNLSNMPNAITSIPSGGGGTGITREVVNGVYQIPTSSFTFSLPSNATDLGDYALYYAFYNSTGLTSVDLSSLTTISGSNSMYFAFSDCTNLTSVDLSSLTTINGSRALYRTFQNCTNLTSVNLSSLTAISGEYGMQNAFYRTGLTNVDLSSLTIISGMFSMQNAFAECSSLTNVNFSNLQTIGTNTSAINYGHLSGCFKDCTNLTSITFPKLEKIYCTGAGNDGTFRGCNKIQKMYFPKLDTITFGAGALSYNQEACKYIFAICSSLTELHFGSANQSAIEATAGYSTAWGRGAGNVTIYFDL